MGNYYEKLIEKHKDILNNPAIIAISKWKYSYPKNNTVFTEKEIQEYTKRSKTILGPLLRKTNKSLENISKNK